MEHVEEILKIAKQRLDDPDYIIDLYDSTFIWASDKGLKLTGYSREDIGKMRNVDIIAFDKSLTESEYRADLIKRLTQDKGEMSLPIKTASGEKITLDVRYAVIEHEQGLYIAGQVLNHQSTE